MRLNVKRATVKEELRKGSTGALGSIVKQHASSVLVTECERALPSSFSLHDALTLTIQRVAATIWVGSIPAFVFANAVASPEEQLFGLFSRFGTIVSITVREKPGTDKSWALVGIVH